CGGLTAALARCREALQEGLTLQIGCHVGETSQLAAAQLVLVRALGGNIAHLEGCYGKHLLALDPVSPILQFGRRGRPPALPVGAGLGTEVDESMVERFAGRRIAFGVLREVASRRLLESSSIPSDSTRSRAFITCVSTRCKRRSRCCALWCK